jgi:adenylylsulfate kinase-like enzyme
MEKKMAMNQAKLAKKRAAKNLKRKGKKYNVNKVIGIRKEIYNPNSEPQLHADTETITL